MISWILCKNIYPKTLRFMCCVTLCCSSFLCRTLAVSSGACWIGKSSLRAISPLWSQAPITPRGPGRDLSRWRCQSSSCNWHLFKKNAPNKLSQDQTISTCLQAQRLDKTFVVNLDEDIERSRLPNKQNLFCSRPFPCEQTHYSNTFLPLNFHWQPLKRETQVSVSCRYYTFQRRQDKKM